MASGDNGLKSIINTISYAALFVLIGGTATAQSETARTEALRESNAKLNSELFSPDYRGALAEAEAALAALKRRWPESSEPKPPACGPLKRGDIEDLERRVLSLPGARIHEFAGAGPQRADVSTFSVFYVFEEDKASDGSAWLQVGRSADCGKIEGWIRSEATQDWRTMLVMQFASRGRRERVLFFKDVNDLAQLISSGYAAEDAMAAYEAISKGEAAEDVFAAIEPKTSAGFAERPFLMPILDWRFELFDDGTDVTLVEVAGLNPQATAGSKGRLRQGRDGQLDPNNPELREFAVGVKFVIDTTVSMQPYIDRTIETVESVYQALEREDLLGRASFGLVAYRDSVAPDPRIEYVVDVVQRLDPEAPPFEVLGNVRRVRRSQVPTRDWDEDAFAGLETAIRDRDWDRLPENSARFIILVTDAGAREGYDPLARNLGVGAQEVIQMARSRGVSIIPIHLQTPEAMKNRNVAAARAQYQLLGRATGDENASSYFGVPAGDPQHFRYLIGNIADGIAEAVANAARGLDARPESGEDLLRQAAPDLFSDSAALSKRVKTLVQNEIFRAQLEFIGARRDEQAPPFYRAWAADRDLTDSRRVSLDVQVFLTRNQLSALAQGLDKIIGAAERNKTSPEDFFKDLKNLSAQVAVEGRARGGEGDIAALLPAFLRALPYRSRILKLNLEDWVALGQTGQDQLISQLKSKQISYEDISRNASLWRNFDEDGAELDDGSAVTAVRLSLLP